MIGLTYFSKVCKQAIANLVASKLRSFLAVLGILVGTASVVTLVSSGNMATEKAMQQFESLGTDLLAVMLFEEQQENTASPQQISLPDVLSIQDDVAGVITVAPYINSFSSISFRGHSYHGSVIGATDSLQKVIHIEMQAGSFISYLNRYQTFAVIGNELYHKIKRQNLIDPLGKQIQLGKQVFTIIGVAKDWSGNSFFNANINNSLIVPIQTISLLGYNAVIRNVVFHIAEDNNLELLQADIEKEIHQHAKGLRTVFRSPRQIIEQMQEQQHVLTLLLSLIGGVSLLVGGIGIMNIMLVSVSERRREIGIRKAIGAMGRDITALFLAESLVLSLFGGFLGVISGIVMSIVIAWFADWPLHIYVMPVVIGFFVSATTGVFFGLYPAIRAAKLSPIEALRTE